jgi:Protein of unknown function (DUF4011)
LTDMVKDKTGHDETRRAVQRLFDETRRRLVETGTRNRLVHVNRASTRGNVLNVADARSDDVYELLAGGALTPFLPARPGRTSEVEGSNALVLPGAQDGADALQTRLEPEALQKKLLKIAREAQTAEEESGVNILYLALGFLTWFEDESSNTAREAPLVLLPVELVRNVRTSSMSSGAARTTSLRTCRFSRGCTTISVSIFPSLMSRRSGGLRIISLQCRPLPRRASDGRSIRTRSILASSASTSSSCIGTLRLTPGRRTRLQPTV